VVFLMIDHSIVRIGSQEEVEKMIFGDSNPEVVFRRLDSAPSHGA
jgi:hypothetical protein